MSEAWGGVPDAYERVVAACDRYRARTGGDVGLLSFSPDTYEALTAALDAAKEPISAERLLRLGGHSAPIPPGADF